MLAVSTARRRRQGSVATVIVVIACLALVGGCTRMIGGTPMPAGGHPSGTVSGLPATSGPSGPKTEAPDAMNPVIGTDNGNTDKIANNAASDINDYWKQAFPQAFPGVHFTPTTKLTSYDSRSSNIVMCGRNTAGLSNAFYCPDDNALIWDHGQFLPELQHAVGPTATVTVLAHEMGHAIQRQAGTAKADAPALVREQQADCFTGAFLRHAAEGRAKHFQVSTGDGLNRAMATLSYHPAEPGNSDAAGENTHGSAFDRVGAFQDGFDGGPARCASLNGEEIEQRTTPFRFWKGAQETRLPRDTASVDAVGQSLREVFHDTGANPPTIVTEPRACGPRPFGGPASYCPDTNTISVDPRQLRDIAQPADRGGSGDFAASAHIASRYALSLQKAAGLPLDDEAAGLRTACMVGTWSGVLVENPVGPRDPVGTLRIGPGDVDEAVTALLSDNGLLAANLGGHQPPAGFARVDAFRMGFQQGLSPCVNKYSA